MTYRTFSLLAAILLVAASIPSAAIGATTLQFDENTALTDESNIQAWNEEKPVHAEVGQVVLNITVAHDASSVGEPSWKYADSQNNYLRLQYNESIERTIRFYVPSDYWPAHAYEMESVGGAQTAEFHPVDGGNYTSVTVTFDGQTDAVFKVDKSTAYVFEGRRWSREVIENTTGISVPSFGAETEWNRLPEDSLTGQNVASAINTTGEPVLIQYDAEPTLEEESWQPVRDCDDGTTDVCRFEKTGVNETVFVMTDQSDPPPIRYKIGGGSRSDRFFASLNELVDISFEIPDKLRNIKPW